MKKIRHMKIRDLRTTRTLNGQPFCWTRQQRGRVFGLKMHASPMITHWVVRGKDGFWSVDGAQQDGVVWGKYRTVFIACAAVEARVFNQDFSLT